MSLYQKYRPVTFDEMIGNKEQIVSLKKQFEKKDHSHAYLFIGEAGVGKTTTARILARTLNGITVEINAADRRGIDAARDIVDMMQTYPLGCEKWIFIIDELHKVTNDFISDLLKPTEDIPNHVYFFCCTTHLPDILKLKDGKAFVSRFSKYNFDSLTENQIIKLLSRISEKENIDLDEEIAESIAENCQGSPRNSLVLLEKVIGMEKEKALKVIQAGSIEDAAVIDLCRGLLQGMNWKKCAEILKGLNDVDSEQIRQTIIGYMNAIILNGSQNDKAAQIIYEFREPFFNIGKGGKAGLTIACYQVIFP